MVRQLEFSLFDFRIHAEYDPEKGARVQEILDEVRAEVAVIKPPEYHRFQHSFSHSFRGRLCCGLLQLQMGGSIIIRRLLKI